LNIFQPGATLPAAQTTQALAILNLMMSTWAAQLAPVTVAGIGIPLISGKAIYTWGPGGDIVAPVPMGQNSLRSASLVLGTTTPSVEVPLAVLTDDMYFAIAIKGLSSTQPTAVYFQGSTPLARLTLWPVPNNAVNIVTVYYDSKFGPFADLSTTTYTFPDGYDEAIIYNLERRFAGPYGRDMPAEDAILARETFANIFRSNQRLSDLPNDFATAFGPSGRRGYNIQTGNY
jgi:hypothetical protein